MTLLVAVLAPAMMVEEVESNVTRGDTDSVPGSYSRPLARQGTITVALRVTVIPGPPPAVGRTLVSVLPEGGPGRVSCGLLL